MSKTKKSAKPSTGKAVKKPAQQLSLQQQLQALDAKQRDYRQQLSADLQKKVSAFVLMRYAANVQGSAELQHYHLQATNERVNRNFFQLSQHPQLQWLCCTTVSPGLGSQRHYWLRNSSTDLYTQRLRNLLGQCLPCAKEQELDLLMRINTVQEVEQWIQDQGLELPAQK